MAPTREFHNISSDENSSDDEAEYASEFEEDVENGSSSARTRENGNNDEDERDSSDSEIEETNGSKRKHDSDSDSEYEVDRRNRRNRASDNQVHQCGISPDDHNCIFQHHSPITLESIAHGLCKMSSDIERAHRDLQEFYKMLNSRLGNILNVASAAKASAPPKNEDSDDSSSDDDDKIIEKLNNLSENNSEVKLEENGQVTEKMDV